MEGREQAREGGNELGREGGRGEARQASSSLVGCARCTGDAPPPSPLRHPGGGRQEPAGGCRASGPGPAGGAALRLDQALHLRLQLLPDLPARKRHPRGPNP